MTYWGQNLTYTFDVLHVCLRVCMFLIVGQTAGPIQSKLGTRIHLDQKVFLASQGLKVKVKVRAL